MEKTPHSKRLCRRPTAFGLTQNPEESTADANDMYYFFGNYVARSEGGAEDLKDTEGEQGVDINLQERFNARFAW